MKLHETAEDFRRRQETRDTKGTAGDCRKLLETIGDCSRLKGNAVDYRVLQETVDTAGDCN